MTPTLETAVAGVALIVASFALGLREFLFRREITITPNARRFVHIALAACCLANLLRGASLLFGLGAGRAAHLDAGGCLNVLVWAGYCVAMVADVVLDRLPAQAWARVRRARARFVAIARRHCVADGETRPSSRG